MRESAGVVTRGWMEDRDATRGEREVRGHDEVRGRMGEIKRH